MNEWDIQNIITNKYRQEDLYFGGTGFKLVCWELMFPSWKINDKGSTWNEISIDFIFYSELINQFLCIELKNNIKSRKELLSAYCQTTQRTIKFKQQYSIVKITLARELCFKNSNKERGGVDSPCTINFQKNPKIKRVLMANTFPADFIQLINSWNSEGLHQLKMLIAMYKYNREFDRFMKLEEGDFDLIKNEGLITIDYRQQGKIMD